MIKKLSFYTVLLLILLHGGRGIAQEISLQDLDKFHIMEDSMVVTADSMYEAFIPDTRVIYSERLVRQLVRTLKINNSYLYKFDTLGKMINIINAEDNSLRIFNWEITPSKITKRYYGAIQLPSDRLKLIGLNDYSEELGNKGLEDSALTNRKWFGAIYYRIMPQQVNGQKFYLLFGYNASSSISNKKILDPMMITSDGAYFGAPIFNVASSNFKGQKIKRFVLEYKKDVQVTMNWDEEKQVIIFDKLVSQINDPNRKYTFAPSGQYDGLKWENNSWNYLSDLIPVKILQDGEAPDEPPVTPKFKE